MDEPQLPSPPPPDKSPATGRALLRMLGAMLATVLVAGGLVVVGLVIYFVIAMNGFGSNK